MFASEFVTAGVGIVAALMILIIVAPLARHQKSRLATALDFRPIRFVGEISLSAYLWHFPVLLMLGRIGWMSGDTLPGDAAQHRPCAGRHHPRRLGHLLPDREAGDELRQAHSSEEEARARLTGRRVRFGNATVPLLRRRCRHRRPVDCASPPRGRARRHRRRARGRAVGGRPSDRSQQRGSSTRASTTNPAA